MKNKATLLLHSFEELIACLTDEEAGGLIKAVLDYDIRGNVTRFEDRSLQFLYIQIKNSLDVHKKHYEKVCDARKKNAEKRWVSSEAQGCGEMQMHTNASEKMQMHTNAYNINENINKNEKENIKEKVNINSNENVCVNESKAESLAEDTQTHKKAYGSFNNVFLTDEEYGAVKGKLPDGERRLESLSAYIAATGRVYSNYYAQILNWSFYGNGHAGGYTDKGYAKSKKPPGERREPTFDVSLFKKKALNPVFVPPEEED